MPAHRLIPYELLFHHVKFSWPAGISYSIMGGLTVAVIVISFI